jgi:hypothetical protein
MQRFFFVTNSIFGVANIGFGVYEATQGAYDSAAVSLLIGLLCTFAAYINVKTN